jgi:hypothetical protein
MNTELTHVDPANFPALTGSNVSDLITQTLAGEPLTPTDLSRIKVPTGGGTSWTVPTASGDETHKELTGILVHVTRQRAYWPDATPTGEPPMCVSSDCVTGVGDPGGKCGTNANPACPHNQWGTAIKQDGSQGRGKACKETKMLFLLREERMLPDVVAVPPGSLQTAKKYLLKLCNEIKKPYFHVVTELTLTKTKQHRVRPDLGPHGGRTE